MKYNLYDRITTDPSNTGQASYPNPPLFNIDPSQNLNKLATHLVEFEPEFVLQSQICSLVSASGRTRAETWAYPDHQYEWSTLNCKDPQQ